MYDPILLESLKNFLLQLLLILITYNLLLTRSFFRKLPLFLVIERLRVQWLGHAIHLVLSYRLLKHRVVSLLGHNRVNLLLLVIIAATAALGWGKVIITLGRWPSLQVKRAIAVGCHSTVKVTRRIVCSCHWLISILWHKFLISQKTKRSEQFGSSWTFKWLE